MTISGSDGAGGILGGGSGGRGPAAGGLALPSILQGTTLRTLTAFAKTPVGFILGALLTGLFATLTRLLRTAVQSILWLFTGAPNSYGLATLPFYFAGLFGGLLGAAGGGLQTATLAVLDAGVSVAGMAGPLSPIILALELAVTGYVAVRLARWSWTALADASIAVIP